MLRSVETIGGSTAKTGAKSVLAKDIAIGGFPLSRFPSLPVHKPRSTIDQGNHSANPI
jgi:hypothetical protein